MTEDSNHRTSTSENFIIAADCVFISYSRKDKDFANKLVKSLREWSVPVWIDTTDIPPGDQWEKTIHKALQTCQIMIVITSPASVQSIHVLNEIRSFVHQGDKSIIYVIYQSANFPTETNPYNRVSFTEQDYSDALNDLLVQLKDKGINIQRTQLTTLTKIVRSIFYSSLFRIGFVMIVVFICLVSTGLFKNGILLTLPTPTPPPSAAPTLILSPTITPTPIQYCVITAFQIRLADGTLHRVSVTQALWRVKPNEIIHIQGVIGGCEFAVSLYQWQSVSGTFTLVKDGSIMYRAPANPIEDEITLIMPTNEGDKEEVLIITVADD